MKNPFKPIVDIVGILFSQIKTVILSLKDLKEAKRIEKKKRVKVFQVEDNNIIRQTSGKLDKDEQFLFVPEQDKVFIRKVTYYDEKLRPIFFVSKNDNYTLQLKDLSDLSVLKVAETRKIKVRRKGTNPSVYINIKPDEIGATIDLKLGDKWDSEGNTGYSFTLDAYRILKTKVLEFLEPVAKRAILIAVSFGVLIGMVLAFTMSMYMG